MQSNNNDNNAGNPFVFSRGLHKKAGKKPGQVITKLFFHADKIQEVIDQLTSALNDQADGVCLTLLEGEGEKGPYAMVTASAITESNNKSQGYTPKPNPRAQNQGYTPKPNPRAQNQGYTPKPKFSTNKRV